VSFYFSPDSFNGETDCIVFRHCIVFHNVRGVCSVATGSATEISWNQGRISDFFAEQPPPPQIYGPILWNVIFPGSGQTMTSALGQGNTLNTHIILDSQNAQKRY